MNACGAAGVALAALVVSALPTAAQQTATTTYVLSTGADTGTCPRTAPCRSFGYAITQTASRGEVIALDAGSYQPFTIDRAVTISSGNPGRPSISAWQSGGIAIAVNAGAGDAVHLRGLQIVGGSVGINVTSAGSLEVSNVAISEMTDKALYVAAATNVVVSKSMLTRNNVAVNAGQGSLFMRDVQVSLASVGVSAAVNAYIVGCTIEIAKTGIEVSSGSTFVKGSLVTQSRRGVQVDTGGNVILDTTTITGNVTGVNISGGTASSYGDNNITDSVVGTITQVKGGRD